MASGKISDIVGTRNEKKDWALIFFVMVHKP